MSVNKGETVRFKVDTDANAYTIDIYRLGYYGGDGARLITTINPSAALPQIQPSPLVDAGTGLVDCGNWAESASWAVPANAISGIYLAKLIRTDTQGMSHIVFVVRDDASTSDLLFQTSDSTWQAYNDYGGNSLYTGSPAGRAYKVSYNRPFNTRATSIANWLFSTEYPMVRWLEANGYDVTYTTGIDSDRRGPLIQQHKVFLSLGHDEYWSGQQRTNVTAARDAGVHLAFFSGNEIFWKTRWENSIDGSSTPYRTLVCYKETHANAKIDPSAEWTGTWRDPRFSPPADGGLPENELTGTLFSVNQGTVSIEVPSEYGGHRFWRNTSVATLAPGTKEVFPPGTLGYEWDSSPDDGFRPAGLMHLSEVTVPGVEILLDFGSTYGPGQETHHLSLYRHAGGALVFGAGTIQWSWGLDDVHDGVSPPTSLSMQQATVNLLADMGSQPGSLQAGLTAATASTDTGAPSSGITAPVTGAQLTTGLEAVISGVASDPEGNLWGVEVSTDGGATWHMAEGRDSWSYTWIPQQAGPHTLLCRAVDDSGNLEVPGAGVSVAVVGVPTYTIWPDTTVPTVVNEADPNALEVGVKFRADVAGKISGIRFYKGPSNTGTHVGNLWSISGSLLATATFTNETASGWQQVDFATPVPVTPGTEYVASYFAPNGNYSVDTGYFAGNGVSSPPLYALGDGENGPNGVYAYGASSSFPTNSFNSSNYWVDVAFQPDLTTITVVPSAATVEIGGTQVYTATGTYADGSTQDLTSQVTWSSSNPSVASIDGNGHATGISVGILTITATLDQMSGNTTLTVEADPVSVWTATDVPGVPDAGPDNALELGVKFRADVDGEITGIRFYKSLSNTGVHVGNLWTSTGTLLATETFAGETASGWQQVDFATPVAITAGTVYVGSYFCPNGGYSFDSGYFDGSGVSSPPLYLLADGESGGNGVFRYGASSEFPDQSANATNYWVDVVFREEPLTISTSTLSDGTVGVAYSATLGSRGGKAPLTWSIASGNLPAGLSLNASTGEISGTPTTLETAAFTVRVDDATQTATKALSLEVGLTPPVSLWTDTTVPTVVDAGPDNAVELGVKFRADVDGIIKGIRFYKSLSNTGTHVGNLWTDTGTLLATATFTNETSSGWQEVEFAAPVSITAGTVYVASYHSPNGGFSIDSGYFSVSGESNPPLYAFADGESGGNGVFRYGASSLFPDQSANAANYWVDVVFQESPELSSIAVTPSGVTKRIGDTQQYTAIGTFVNGGTADLTSQVTWSSSNPGAASVDSGGQATALSIGTSTISATLSGVSGGALLTVEPDPLTIWPDTTVPGLADAGPDNAVELGVRFRADVDGEIKGIRFYKSLSNTGTHVGNLWTDTGTLLASATFTNETPSGWQEVVFATPVSITAGTAYVASYHSPNGGYSIDLGFFSGGGVSNPPLYAFADSEGGNGVHRYGATSQFPDVADNAANFWVDVLFQPELSSLAVTPAGATVTTGAVQQYTATGTYADGSTQDLTNQVAWSSSSPGVASISTFGEASAIALGSTTITATLDGISGDTTLTVESAPVSIWAATTVPAIEDTGPDDPVELGVKFRSDVDGEITGIRFYKSASNTGVHVGSLWSITGALLASETFTGETGSGWQQVDFATPVPVTAGTAYVASYHCPNGGFSIDPGYFSLGGVSNPPLYAFADGENGGNGVFKYAASSQFPDQSANAANYWVDPVFKAGPVLSSIAVTPDAATLTTGATQQYTATGTYTDASTVDLTSQVTWTSSTPGVASIDANGLASAWSVGNTTITATLDGVVGSTGLTVQTGPLTVATTSLPDGMVGAAYSATLAATGGTLPYTWSLDSGSLPVGLTLDTNSGEISGTPGAVETANFTVKVTDATAGTATQPLSLTVGPAPPKMIWDAADVPGIVDSGPDDPVELGLKFRADVDGQITGIRFYKSASNTGIHVGNLWSSTGTLLGSETFTGETASGWQQVDFTTPVAITAGTVYVASYHCPNGGYSFDAGYFAASGKSNPPLYAFADGEAGGNGVLAYGATSQFPTQSFNSANYWVDVVFQEGPTLNSIAVTPAGATILTGATQQYTATGTYSDASTQDVTGLVAWTSSNPGVATIDANGLANALAVGNTTITATLDGVVGDTGLTVDTGPLTVSTTSLPDGTVGVAYSETLAAAGGTLPYTWSLDSGSLPAGLTLNASSGEIAGTPTTVEFANFTVKVTDAAAQVATQPLSLLVNPAPPVSIWGEAAVPSVVDTGPEIGVELGVKFRSDVDGYILGVRFYKSLTNTGTHVGNLWTIGGTLLASAIFTGETASGWQQVDFATPVAITAGTVYVASYHCPNGGFSLDTGYFSGGGVSNPPLYALANGENGPNGVYVYAPSSQFPNQSFNAPNYWVDVSFVDALAPDVTPPTLAVVAPLDGQTDLGLNTEFFARFSEPMDPLTVDTNTVLLEDSQGGSVSADVTYVNGTSTVRLMPLANLSPDETYTVTVKGGAGGVADVAGNTLIADVLVDFDTVKSDIYGGGPGGPILVITDSVNPFTRYYAEILLAEGLNEFAMEDISNLTNAAVLAPYEVVILGETALTANQVTLLTDWVTNDGGNLIAMRPDKQLAGLLGLVDQAATLSEGYLLMDTTAVPGAGLADETIQFHGTADLYTLGSAVSLGTLYSDATTATANPAVTLRTVGGNGGQAAAFTYDLARSVVLTRQGNPAWAGQDRDGDAPIRSNDLFYGASAQDPQPDWVNLDKVAIPQADEQQRLLANLILYTNADRNLLPRFWYFPDGHKAVVVMTGDEHANGGTGQFWDQYSGLSDPGGSVVDWETIRASSYIYPDPAAMTDAEAVVYTDAGFELGIHVDTNCANFTAQQFDTLASQQFASWRAMYPSIPYSPSHRTHCVAWSDYTTAAEAQELFGIRLDVNYYYFPATWVADRPGMFTGSGIPMRFAKSDGTVIDVYQAPTQMTDESGQSYPFTSDSLLDRALGVEGYFGAFVTNMHTDDFRFAEPFDDAIIASATSRGVPVISSRQLLTWIDARNRSSMSNIQWNNGVQSFTVDARALARGLEVMVVVPDGQTVSGVTRDGGAVAHEIREVKGLQYVVMPALSGNYAVSFVADATPPTVTAVDPADLETDVVRYTSVTATFSEPMDSLTIDGSTVVLRDPASNVVGSTVTYEPGTLTVTLQPDAVLDPNTTYTATVVGGPGGVLDAAGNPLVADEVWTFTTAANLPLSIWAPSDVPAVVDAGPDSPVAVGCKFTSDVAGFITGVRFYKAATNTGLHVGKLWTSTGTELASADFTNETASGWQQVDFASPVAIAANTTYVVSYHSLSGHLSVDHEYFSSGGADNGSLHALPSGLAGGNGVYGYGPSNVFPDQSYRDANYWVDVVFKLTVP